MDTSFACQIESICPPYRCANTWKMTSWPPAFVLPVPHTMLGDDEITFDPDEIASVAKDCSGWRKIVITCSAAE
jgi:hypothetical protein